MLASQHACLDAVKPGADFHDYHKAAERVLAQGYIDLGLCKGTLDEVLESGSYKQFYMHRAGHWLGMDVHDAGAVPGQGRVAEAACPAWCSPSSPAPTSAPPTTCRSTFWNIGVRIEDDVLVTADGPREPDGGDAEDGGGRRSGLRAVERAMHDVVIVGAGPVGGTLALAIADARSRRRRARRARAAARRCAATARSRCRTARG